MSAAKLEQRSGEITAEILTLQGELVQAEAEASEQYQQLAGDVVLHLVTDEDAHKRRAAIEDDLDRRRERLATLEASLPELERRRLAEEESVRQRELTVTRRKLADNVSSYDRAVRNLRGALKPVIPAAIEVERWRELVFAASAAEEALLLPHEQATTVPDEEWEIDEGALGFLTAGPFTPNADAAAELEAVRETRSLQDVQLIEWFAAWPHDERLAQLPERLRDTPEVRKAQEAYDAKLELQRETRRAREVERSVARL
jgi:hypothetical protein